MKRISLFAKGNVDVHDALHSCRIGGEIHWNGLNAVLRKQFPGVTARVIHETFTRSDALLAADGSMPAALRARDLPLGSHWSDSQFSTAIFESHADAFVLSNQPDIATNLVRHRAEGYLLYPNQLSAWPSADRAWLRDEFEPVEPLTVEQSLSNFTAMIEAIRARNNDAPILIFNVSSVVPGETIHCFQGFAEALSTRIKRFNLGLVELSETLGVSIVDVDAIIATHGAERLKHDWIHLSPHGYALIAEEVVRILSDCGVIEQDELAYAR